MAKTKAKQIQSILVPQPKPQDAYSPYAELVNNYHLKIDFKPFIRLQSAALSEFRKRRKEILMHTAVVFTSRHTVHHFFELCKSINLEMPVDTKYICTTQQIKHYLQKYKTPKQRQMLTCKHNNSDDLGHLVKRHQQEYFLVPCSEANQKRMDNLMESQGCQYTTLSTHRMVANDLSDLMDKHYDIITFFSPVEVKIFVARFPNFDTKQTAIATFGQETARAIHRAGWTPHIQAPTPQAPSIVDALRLYLKSQV